MHIECVYLLTCICMTMPVRFQLCVCVGGTLGHMGVSQKTVNEAWKKKSGISVADMHELCDKQVGLICRSEL